MVINVKENILNMDNIIAIENFWLTDELSPDGVKIYYIGSENHIKLYGITTQDVNDAIVNQTF